MIFRFRMIGAEETVSAIHDLKNEETSNLDENHIAGETMTKANQRYLYNVIIIIIMRQIIF